MLCGVVVGGWCGFYVCCLIVVVVGWGGCVGVGGRIGSVGCVVVQGSNYVVYWDGVVYFDVYGFDGVCCVCWDFDYGFVGFDFDDGLVFGYVVVRVDEDCYYGVFFDVVFDIGEFEFSCYDGIFWMVDGCIINWGIV